MSCPSHSQTVLSEGGLLRLRRRLPAERLLLGDTGFILTTDTTGRHQRLEKGWISAKSRSPHRRIFEGIASDTVMTATCPNERIGGVWLGDGVKRQAAGFRLSGW